MPTLRKKALVKANIKLFLEDLLLRDGFFTTVMPAEVNVYGADISRLQPGDVVYPVFDPSSPLDNTIFQSAFKNWVHEDGLPAISGIGAPIVASGVTVDGTFYPRSSGDPGYSATFAHIIDYPNGRIIFDSPLAGTPIVQAEFSYKEILVDGANIFNNEKSPILIETAFKDNPAETGVDIYPDYNARTLPAVFIDFLDRESSPYELGTRNPIVDFFGVFHIWARDEFIRDAIEDIIGDEHRQTLLGIDFNTAPDPLLYNGDKNPNYQGYKALASLGSPHFWRRIYIESITNRKDSPLYEVERSRIDFNIRVYPNF